MCPHFDIVKPHGAADYKVLWCFVGILWLECGVVFEFIDILRCRVCCYGNGEMCYHGSRQRSEDQKMAPLGARAYLLPGSSNINIAQCECIATCLLKEPTLPSFETY